MRSWIVVVGVTALLSAPLVHAEVKKTKRIWSRAQTTWIYRAAKRDKHPIGYVRLGQSVELRDEPAVKGPGCADSYYPVKPFGWVCLDRAATLDGSGRWLSAMKLAAPSKTLLPFEFALSNGAPMYRRLPTKSEWQKEEREFGKAGSFKPQSWGNRGHEHLAVQTPILGKQKLPWFLEKGGSVGTESTLGLVRRQIPHGSMLAYSKSFEHDGRTWLFSSDGTVVPADRVRKFRVSSFQGVDLTSSVKLPLAFFREKARPKYKQTEDGFQKTGTDWAVRTWVMLDPDADPVEQSGRVYLRTREVDASGQKLFTLETDATVIRTREQAPIGVDAGQKWLIISITEGTLVAYEGMKPVYATLISPGAGGVPVPGKNPVKMSTTPLGVYRVTFKHLASTMSPEYGEKRKFWIADVPYTQYFNAPFALHTAYWHEKFGEPMSAGCVNLSPLDGKRLFDWTQPHVPAGWAGAGPGGPNGVGTYVVISR
jgi:hypothetical protein